MGTIFANYKNCKTSDPHRLILSFSEKINLKRSNEYVSLSNLSIYYTWKDMKKSSKSNPFKVSALTWNEEFELHYGLSFVSDIQDYLKCIIKTHEAGDNPPRRIL